MATTRSPRYPNISLEVAIGKARMIYDKEHMSPMTPTSAAEAMGYSGISGASLKTISSLRKYGILEGRGDDVRLSKEAQTLILDDFDSIDYQQAFKNCALKPDVFADLHRQFGESGSERNISIYLEKQGFKPQAASTVAQHYKEVVGVIIDSTDLADNELDNDNIENEHIEASIDARSTAVSTPPPTAKPNGAPLVIVNGELHINEVVDLTNIGHFKQKLEIYENLLRLEESQNEDVPEI